MLRGSFCLGTRRIRAPPFMWVTTTTSIAAALILFQALLSQACAATDAPSSSRCLTCFARAFSVSVAVNSKQQTANSLADYYLPRQSTFRRCCLLFAVPPLPLPHYPLAIWLG